MKIRIETIPHKAQRYPTVGDWEILGKDELLIRVSNMKNWKYELLVAVHELIEVMLCTDRGITEEEVNEFDKIYEATRPKGDVREPGDDIDAPYRKEHRFSTRVEKMLAKELKVDWKKYDRTVNNL